MCVQFHLCRRVFLPCLLLLFVSLFLLSSCLCRHFCHVCLFCFLSFFFVVMWLFVSVLSDCFMQISVSFASLLSRFSFVCFSFFVLFICLVCFICYRLIHLTCLFIICYFRLVHPLICSFSSFVSLCSFTVCVYLFNLSLFTVCLFLVCCGFRWLFRSCFLYTCVSARPLSV